MLPSGMVNKVEYGVISCHIFWSSGLQLFILYKLGLWKLRPRAG